MEQRFCHSGDSRTSASTSLLPTAGSEGNVGLDPRRKQPFQARFCLTPLYFTHTSTQQPAVLRGVSAMVRILFATRRQGSGGGGSSTTRFLFPFPLPSSAQALQPVLAERPAPLLSQKTAETTRTQPTSTNTDLYSQLGKISPRRANATVSVWPRAQPLPRIPVSPGEAAQAALGSCCKG